MGLIHTHRVGTRMADMVWAQNYSCELDETELRKLLYLSVKLLAVFMRKVRLKDWSMCCFTSGKRGSPAQLSQRLFYPKPIP